MISIPVRIYVLCKAKWIKSKKPTNIGKRLNDYRKSINTNENLIVFSFFQSPLSFDLNASSIIPKVITVSPEWAATLILSNDDATKNAFQITKGHELAHKDGDFAVLFWERKRKRYIHKEDRKFVNWVTEVHHDFAAAEKMVESSKKKLIESIEYKIAMKPNNTDSTSHPSWKQRKSYAEIGAFNRQLIDTIAFNTDCTNITLIEEVSCFYKDIILMD